MPTTYAFQITNAIFPPAANASVGALATIILQTLISLAAVLAFIFIIISGIKIVTSGGDSKKLAGAQATLLYAIIGLIVTVLALVIVNFVQKFMGSNIVIY